MRKLVLLPAFALAALLVQAGSAQAQVEIDFTAIAPPGNLGSSTYTDPATGLTVSGFWFNGAAWEPANLYVRNNPADHGLGVCSPRDIDPETGDCPGPNGGGDFNELDNDDASELIVLTLPAGYEWASVQVSSLDTNDGGPIPERGILYADNDGVFSTTFGSVGDAVLKEFGGDTDPLEAVFGIGATYSTAQYLVFEPFDHTGGGATNNDYLVYAATIIPPPEGGEGCTPGYWKQAHHFDDWVGFVPGQDYETVFGVTTSASFAAETLVQALKQGGGGERALGRHAVAALLNSANPNVSYAFTTAQVIAKVQWAYATGNFEDVKNELEAENQSGCPLPVDGRTAPTSRQGEKGSGNAHVNRQ